MFCGRPNRTKITRREHVQWCGPSRNLTFEECELADLGFAGDPFTWRNNSHTSSAYIRERLDLAVASGDLISHFPLYKVNNGEPRHSDHRPVIVVTDGGACNRRSAGPLQFRFKAGWVKEEDCPAIVDNLEKIDGDNRRGGAGGCPLCSSGFRGLE